MPRRAAGVSRLVDASVLIPQVLRVAVARWSRRQRSREFQLINQGAYAPRSPLEFNIRLENLPHGRRATIHKHPLIG